MSTKVLTHNDAFKAVSVIYNQQFILWQYVGQKISKGANYCWKLYLNKVWGID